MWEFALTICDQDCGRTDLDAQRRITGHTQDFAKPSTTIPPKLNSFLSLVTRPPDIRRKVCFIHILEFLHESNMQNDIASTLRKIHLSCCDTDAALS